MMKTVPLLCGGETVGRGRMETDFLYTRLYIRIPYRAGLWSVWVVGDTGEMRVGIPEPEQRELILKRRLSLRTLAPVGKILHLELRRHGAGVQTAHCTVQTTPLQQHISGQPDAHNELLQSAHEEPLRKERDKPLHDVNDRNAKDKPLHSANDRNTDDELLHNGVWETVTQIPLHTEEFTRQLSGNLRGTLRRCNGEYWNLAFPWNTDAPFPLPGLFCLARVRKIAGRSYCVFTFDRRERPVL